MVKLLAPKLYEEFQISKLLDNKLSCDIPRPYTLFLQLKFGRCKLNGAEIGFGAGFNAENLLSMLTIDKLYCIDPFLFKTYYQGKYRYTYDNKTIYKQLIGDHRVEFIELPINNAVEEISELHNLDFLYIDGNHTYDFVLNDLNHAVKIVRDGGVIGGHDFIHFRNYGVIHSVIDFCFERGIKFDFEPPDFWFINKKSR